MVVCDELLVGGFLTWLIVVVCGCSVCVLACLFCGRLRCLWYCGVMVLILKLDLVVVV